MSALHSSGEGSIHSLENCPVDAAIVFGRVHVRQDESVRHGYLPGAAPLFRQIGPEAAVAVPFQDLSDMTAADEGRMAPPAHECRVQYRASGICFGIPIRRAGPPGIRELPDGVFPHQGHVHRQHEKARAS